MVALPLHAVRAKSKKYGIILFIFEIMRILTDSIDVKTDYPTSLAILCQHMTLFYYGIDFLYFLQNKNDNPKSAIIIRSQFDTNLRQIQQAAKIISDY